MRLFFALWPNDEIRAQLAHQRDLMVRDYHGVATRNTRFHLTLVFMDGMPGSYLPAFAACGDGIEIAPFTLRIDARSSFRHGVGWLGCMETPPALVELQQTLQAHVEQTLGIRYTGEFTPHITTARKCLYLPPAGPIKPVIEWPVERFVLIHSILDPGRSHYEVLKTWPLTGRQHRHLLNDAG